MGVTKIATCCYCGSKAALVLRGKTQHELSCGTCGAPLKAMKMLRVKPDRATAPAATPARTGHASAPAKFRKTSKKRKKSKGFKAKLWEELWDVIEDVFD